MGQKVNPIGFRIGIRENWRSRWYANKKDYSRYLQEDHKIRKHIKKEYKFSNIPLIEIERTDERVNIILYTARPGPIIGKKGSNVEKLRKELEKFITDKPDSDKKRAINLEIKEVSKPNVNAQLLAEGVAENLEKRANFRRVLKKTTEIALESRVEGIKIQISGRLSGADMARTESVSIGKIPLQTLDANIQYGFTEARTTYGIIGVKVWTYLGKYGEEVVYDGVSTQKTKASKNPKR